MRVVTTLTFDFELGIREIDWERWAIKYLFVCIYRERDKKKNEAITIIDERRVYAIGEQSSRWRRQLDFLFSFLRSLFVTHHPSLFFLLFSFVHIDEAIWRSFTHTHTHTHTLKIQSKSSPSSIFYCCRRSCWHEKCSCPQASSTHDSDKERERERIHIDTPFFFTSRLFKDVLKK